MRALHLGLLAVVGIILIGFSQFFFVSDSEFWSWNVAFNISECLGFEWFWDRPLFYGLLGLVNLFDLGVWQNLLISRALMAITAGLVVACSSLIVMRLTQQRLYAIFCVLFIVSNTAFISQAYKMRSDMLSTLIILLGLLLYLTLKKKWIGVLVGSFALFVTPKSVFIILPFVCALLWINRKNILKKNIPWKIVVPAVSLVIVPLLILNHYFHILDRNAWYLGEITAGHQILGLKMYFWDHLEGNFLAWIFVALVLAWTVLRKLKSIEQKLVFALTIYFILLLSIYPEPVPFFIAAVLPFIAIGISYLLFHLQLSERLVVATVSTLLILSFSSMQKWAGQKRSGVMLSDQIEFFNRVDLFMEKYRFKSVYDGAGGMPHRMSHMVFLGTNKTVQNSVMTRALTAPFPDILIANNRTKMLGADFANFLIQGYYQLSPGIYVRMIGRNRGVSQIYNKPYRIKVLQWLSQHKFGHSLQQEVITRSIDLSAANQIEHKQISLRDYFEYLPMEASSFIFPKIRHDFGKYSVNEIYSFD